MAAAVLVAGILVGKQVFGNPGGPTWTAEFTNARGLLAGNDVRVGGAVAGRVTSISLSRRGRALVRFQLSDAVAAPHADAAAAIEPADLLGDVYMSLSPGSARAPLRGDIVPARTVNAPRLDQVLDAFNPQVRDGLGALLVEGGLALDQRGGDLARTLVALRPALSAAGGVLAELDTQDGSLARLVPQAARAAAELDSRRADLGSAADALATTLRATARTAASAQQGLAGLPATLTQLQATAGGLSASAGAATPLVRRLVPEMTPLTRVIRELPALTARVQSAAPTFERALGGAAAALQAGSGGFTRLADAFPALRAQAPAITTLLGELDSAAPGIAQGFFVDFPDQAAESGSQPFDPFADPRRAYWRGAAVFSCEAFGVPVAPGCMPRAFANLLRQPTLSKDHIRTASALLDYLLKR